MVEVGLIGRFSLALANPTVSATVLIAGMLVFSGLGSLVSTRIIDRAKTVMPLVFLLIAVGLSVLGATAGSWGAAWSSAGRAGE